MHIRKLVFAKLTFHESLRDIEARLRAQSSKSRNTFANANATRDWRIYCELIKSAALCCIRRRA